MSLILVTEIPLCYVKNLDSSTLKTIEQGHDWFGCQSALRDKESSWTHQGQEVPEFS